MKKLISIIFYPLKLLALLLIYIYKILISPLFPKSCKFKPSCSTYGIIAIKRFGVIEGIFLTAKRLVRCRPGTKGGNDYVPDNIKGDIKWIL